MTRPDIVACCTDQPLVDRGVQVKPAMIKMPSWFRVESKRTLRDDRRSELESTNQTSVHGYKQKVPSC
jgi:hypothetical protein